MQENMNYFNGHLYVLILIELLGFFKIYVKRYWTSNVTKCPRKYHELCINEKYLYFKSKLDCSLRITGVK